MWGWLIPPWIKVAVVAALLTSVIGGFLWWRHSIRADAVQDIKIEQQTNQIKKLDNATNAQNRTRHNLRRHPDRVHDDDGFRRD